jgi:uncharacterized membrane protein
MKKTRGYVVSAVIAGLLILAPIYFAILLLLKAMKSVGAIVRPIAMLLPEWMFGEHLLALLVVLVACFFVGVLVRTPAGRAGREQLEKNLFAKIPGYALFRSMTQQLAGSSQEKVWKPALAEIEDALVPSFIIEELGDGRLTVFVPSIPTPLAGAVYVLPRERVHPVDVPFTQALQTVSRWGSGAGALVAAMKTKDS